MHTQERVVTPNLPAPPFLLLPFSPGARHSAIKLIYVHNAIQRVAPSRPSAPGIIFLFSFTVAVAVSVSFSISCSPPCKMQFPKMLRMLLPVHDDADDVVRYKNSCYKYELQDKHKNRKLCYVAIFISISFRFA